MEPTDFKNVIVENIHWALCDKHAFKKSIMNSDKKLDDFEILASVTSKTTSKPQQPQSHPVDFILNGTITFLKSVGSTDQNAL